MFTPFVTDEQPVALYEGVPPQYTSEGLAIDCALVLHVLRGTARIDCNFVTISEKPGSVVLFNPGDVIRVEERSFDFKVEILAFTTFIQLAAVNQLEDVSVDALKMNRVLDIAEASSAASGMMQLMRQAIATCSPRELYFVSIMQLRAFFMLCTAALRRHNIAVDTFRNRGDELFYRFRSLLAEHCRTSRSVAFYADKLCVTSRHLTEIVRQRYHHSAKEAIDTYTVMQLRLELLQSDIPLAELADRYNFSSPAFFSDYFHRHAGLSPQDYRQRNKQ